MVEITQEELDKLRAGANRQGGRSGPLGAPEGEGLAARSIADYLRGGGGGQRSRGPIAGGSGQGRLSYGANTQGSSTPDFRALAAQRGAARDAGASVSQLQQADAIQRQQNQNPLGYNDRQTKALEAAWSSSPDKVALDAQNAQRASQGLSPIQSDYGLNRYHTNADGSRDYNYSADGQYRGAIPDQFRNAPGDANTHDAHFNKDTGQWEAGDLSLTQTFKDIGGGFKDAYSNIRETIPLMGAEVVDAGKGLLSNLGGLFSPAPVAAAPVDNRDRQSAGSKALAASTRAQLGKQSAFQSANKATTKGAASDYGGFNMGGPIGYNAGGVARTNLREEEIQQQQRMANAPQVASSGGGLKDQLSKKVIGSLLGGLGGIFNDGGMVGHRMAGGRFMSGVEHKGSGGAVTGMSPDTFINGKIKSVHYPTPAGARNQPVHLNRGGMAGPLNPNGYNEGGAAGETPIKKVMDEQKLAQQAKAFDLEQGRKQEAHDMAMKQKKAAFSEAQKMKKESATTKMKPKAPLGGK